MYVVQKKSICVFEYFTGFQNKITQKGPVLIKQIFLPFQISRFIITEKYICVKSKNRTQIRDHEFEKLFYEENRGILTTRTKNQNQESFNSNNFTFDFVEELELQCEINNDDMVSWRVLIKKKSNSTDPKYLREYWSEKQNILTKHTSIIKCKSEMVDPTNKNRRFQICKSPLFLNQMGYIQNFYIWPISSSDIQIGIFFNQKQGLNFTQNALYEICSAQFKETNIKNIFYYEFQNTSAVKSKDGPHLFVIVCQNPTKDKSKIKILVLEILPEQSIQNNQDQNQALNNYIDQFNQLSKQKKSQQSISNNILFNQIISYQEKSGLGSNPNKPTTVLQTLAIKNSCSLKRVFYNPNTKVLWINDTSDMVYRVKLLQSGDIRSIKEKNISFFESLQGFRNGEIGPDLQGIIYDNYPIFKVKAYSLEIGLRSQVPSITDLSPEFQQNANLQKNVQDQKQIIEFDDKQLEKIQKQKSYTPKDPQVDEKKADSKNQVNQLILNTKETKQFQTQTQGHDQENVFNQPKPDSQSQQTQTDPEIPIQKNQQDLKQIQLNNLSDLLKELNFNKVEDVLIRFSTLFSANVTKNINKLKQSNSKAKEQIKLKINGDIFDLIKEVFSSIMDDTLGQKIQKQVAKAKDYVGKIFNKQIEHFNLMMMEEKTKEQNIKKHILEEQLRSIQTIKEASFKFLDVTKVREMQKIAYNQVILQSINEVAKKIQALQSRVDEIFRDSELAQRKITAEVKEIKETFKLLIQLEENSNQEEEGSQSDEVRSQSGFESQEEEDESQDQKDIDKRQKLEQKRVLSYQKFQGGHHPPFIHPHLHSNNQRITGWNQSYQVPLNYPYPLYPMPMPQQPYYFSPYQNQSLAQSHDPQKGPWMSTISSHQDRFLPPQREVQPFYSQIRSGSKKTEDPLKVDKKKKAKTTRKASQSIRNE